MKETLGKIQAEMDKASKDVNKARFAAPLSTVMADLQDDPEISDDVLLSLNQDSRRMALMGFCLLLMQGLQ